MASKNGAAVRIAQNPTTRHILGEMTGFLKSLSQLFTTPAECLLLMSALLLLPGCASETYAPDVAPEYVVIRDFSAFYRLGPQQGRGPDTSLRVGTRVKLLSKEMGFSLVQLEDLRTGYMANENMTLAPPRPPEQAKQEAETAASKKRGGRSKGDDSPVYSGAQVNDTPLPDPNMPPPDLNVEPEIVPNNIPAPDATPAKPPKFRY